MTIDNQEARIKREHKEMLFALETSVCGGCDTIMGVPYKGNLPCVCKGTRALIVRVREGMTNE